jgi:hypothetical protein
LQSAVKAALRLRSAEEPLSRFNPGGYLLPTYFHRFQAQAPVRSLDGYARGGDAIHADDADAVLLLLVDEFNRSMPNGVATPEMSEAWTDLVQASRSGSVDISGPIRRLRSYLVDHFALNERVVVYEDSGTDLLPGLGRVRCAGLGRRPDSEWPPTDATFFRSRCRHPTAA